MEVLLEAGADPSIADGTSFNPLHTCCKRGYLTCVSFFSLAYSVCEHCTYKFHVCQGGCCGQVLTTVSNLPLWTDGSCRQVVDMKECMYICY